MKKLPGGSSFLQVRIGDRGARPRANAWRGSISSAARRLSRAVLRVAGSVMLAGCAALHAGCDRSQPVVTVYTSIDQQFAAAILERFEKKSGVRVAAVYDTEAAKTTGLVLRLAREKERPRCDVWWSSEVFGSVELARQGVLAAYDSPEAADIPTEWKDAQQRWTGLAARARVLAYHTGRVKREELPLTWADLDRPEWIKRLALANPQFGTTRGHFGAIFANWGEKNGGEFVRHLREFGATLADGNSMAVQTVLRGGADVCMTDTDDVWVAKSRGEAINMIYPAINAGAPAIWIPCTVALIAHSPQPGLGKQLFDFLVSAETEEALMLSESRNVPLRQAVRARMVFDSPAPQALDYEKIADGIPAAMKVAREELLR